MTDKLTTLLHDRADTVAFDSPDLDTVTRAGDRRVRRRRTLVTAGGAAAAVVLAVGVALYPGADSVVDRDAATGPSSEPAPLSWVTGSTLHVGPDRTVDLGREVATYVRTGEGYVFADRAGRLWSWEDGESFGIGLTTKGEDATRLVADPDTSTMAFVDGGVGPAQVVVFDQVRGGFDVLPTEGPATLYGLDAGTVYWRDARGIVAADVSAATVEVLADGPRAADLSDVETRTFATPTAGGTVVGDAPGEGVRLEEAYGSTGVLSPDGRYYSSEGDEQSVFDARTGQRVQLDLTQEFATGYEWLDGSTLAVLAAERPSTQATAQLLRCTVPAGDCEVVAADLGTIGDLQGTLALPTGDPVG
ncbi:hypothetical protein [Nocardioides sp. GXQ0305]|uniref:hypothetical protein n=1 Tax=Nocardioides sp. GXQ0305 TaxID=3423912 RepID=UPI003D7EC1AE